MANGETLPSDFGTTATFTATESKEQLISVAGNYSGCRVSADKNFWGSVTGYNVLCGYNSKDYAKWQTFRGLMSQAGISWRDEHAQHPGTGSSSLQFYDKSEADRACAIANDIIDLGRWASSAPAYTIDDSYAGGGIIKKFGRISYMIPYSSVMAAQNRQEAENTAESEKKVSADQHETEINKTNTATQKQERLIEQTKANGLQTLIWVGVAVVAAMIIGGIVLIVKKVKKN